MAKFLKKFTELTAYTAAQSTLELPNVSLITENGEVKYNPSEPAETRIIATFNVTDTSNPTQLCNNSSVSQFSSIEIDGVELPSVVSAYTFDTEGEHTVKYTLTDSTSIGQQAFYNCSGLTSIDIPSGVTSIGDAAFQGCSSLTSIDIPSGVTSIGDAAFQGCSSLTSIVIPDSVTRIGGFAFQNCSGFTSCTIGSGVTSIGMYAFNRCTSLTSIDIPNSVISIGGFAFQDCSGFTSINIPSGVTSIGDSAFFNCSSLTSIVSNATTAPTIFSRTFRNVKTGGTLTVPQGSSDYDVWMGTGNYYLGKYNWTKVEQ